MMMHKGMAEHGQMHGGEMPEMWELLTMEQKKQIAVMKMDMKIQWMEMKISEMEKMIEMKKKSIEQMKKIQAMMK